MPILSIVIPIYNVERYIKKCLQSILTQENDFLEYELILINDGTPDNSMAIVESMLLNRQNVKIINQNNQGLSQARNHGLAKASGEFVWFVDSDDYVDTNAFSTIQKAITKEDADIYAFNITVLNEKTNKTYIWHSVYEKYGTTLFEQVRTGIDLQRKIPMTPIQRFVYRKKFLNQHGLQFYPGILHEDVEFSLRANFYADKIVCLNRTIYCYLERSSGSITSDFGLKNISSLIEICKLREQFLGRAKSKQGGVAMVYDDLFDIAVSVKSNKSKKVKGYTIFMKGHISYINHLIIKSFFRSIPRYFTLGKLVRFIKSFL